LVRAALQVARLEEQLEQKGTQLTSLTERVAEAERRIRNRPAGAQESGNSALVERIQRLEAENRRLKLGRASPARTPVVENGSDGEDD